MLFIVRFRFPINVRTKLVLGSSIAWNKLGQDIDGEADYDISGESVVTN